MSTSEIVNIYDAFARPPLMVENGLLFDYNGARSFDKNELTKSLVAFRRL